MPRADFYLIAKPRFREEPLRLVCELARKAHDSGQPTLVLARDREQAEALDDLLWAFDDDAYIPHQIAGDDEDDLAPVLIATPDMDVALRPLVLARDREQAEALDDLLWAFDDDAYVPHQVAGDEEDDLTPVLIATPDMDVPLRPLLINLRDDAVDGGFERVLEVVPADESARGPLRERWKHYKARGLEVHSHEM